MVFALEYIQLLEGADGDYYQFYALIFLTAYLLVQLSMLKSLLDKYWPDVYNIVASMGGLSACLLAGISLTIGTKAKRLANTSPLR
jgi:uncharacterized membrane protein YfhO